MRSLSAKRGFTLIELLVVIAIIAILASILFPVFAKAREKARQTTCMSKVRQMAVASQMYNQDNNGHFPGIAMGSWDTVLSGYLGNNPAMFNCPSDSSSSDTVNSYGFNGLLIKADGNGVNESQITAPTEVGVICDASPSKAFGNGGLVGNGGLQDDATMAVIPAARHSNGTVIGYADGHAKYAPNGYNPKDISNEVTRAFYMVNALGLINNPAGGLGNFNLLSATPVTSTFTIGGDFCVSPIMIAAAEAWKKKAQGADYYTRGFLGEGNTTGRGLNWAWGRSDNNPNPSVAFATVSAVGKDALVFIVSKNTKIPTSYFATTANGVNVATTAQLAVLFGANEGNSTNQFQSYTYDTNSGNYKFMTSAAVMGSDWTSVAIPANLSGIDAGTKNFGTQSVTATDDQDMVEKVANDPYGIGYCSSAMADPNRVQILGVQLGGVNYFFPQANAKYRWIMPNTTTSLNWPSQFIRTLYVDSYGSAVGFSLADYTSNMLAAGSPGLTAIQAGSLFECSYFAN